MNLSPVDASLPPSLHTEVMQHLLSYANVSSIEATLKVDRHWRQAALQLLAREAFKQIEEAYSTVVADLNPHRYASQLKQLQITLEETNDAFFCGPLPLSSLTFIKGRLRIANQELRAQLQSLAPAHLMSLTPLIAQIEKKEVFSRPLFPDLKRLAEISSLAAEEMMDEEEELNSYTSYLMEIEELVASLQESSLKPFPLLTDEMEVIVEESGFTLKPFDKSALIFSKEREDLTLQGSLQRIYEQTEEIFSWLIDAFDPVKQRLERKRLIAALKELSLLFFQGKVGLEQLKSAKKLLSFYWRQLDLNDFFRLKPIRELLLQKGATRSCAEIEKKLLSIVDPVDLTLKSCSDAQFIDVIVDLLQERYYLLALHTISFIQDDKKREALSIESWQFIQEQPLSLYPTSQERQWLLAKGIEFLAPKKQLPLYEVLFKELSGNAKQLVSYLNSIPSDEIKRDLASNFVIPSLKKEGRYALAFKVIGRHLIGREKDLRLMMIADDFYERGEVAMAKKAIAAIVYPRYRDERKEVLQQRIDSDREAIVILESLIVEKKYVEQLSLIKTIACKPVQKEAYQVLANHLALDNEAQWVEKMAFLFRARAMSLKWLTMIEDKEVRLEIIGRLVSVLLKEGAHTHVNDHVDDDVAKICRYLPKD